MLLEFIVWIVLERGGRLPAFLRFNIKDTFEKGRANRSFFMPRQNQGAYLLKQSYLTRGL